MKTSEGILYLTEVLVAFLTVRLPQQLIIVRIPEVFVGSAGEMRRHHHDLVTQTNAVLSCFYHLLLFSCKSEKKINILIKWNYYYYYFH